MTCTGFAFFVAHLTCTQPAPPPDTYCSLSRPIYWSSQDTRPTKEQVDKHNRVWKLLCSEKRK